MRSISLADQVFEKLEHDVISGVLARGEAFTEQQLADRLNVSRTPIREALRRLGQERLIVESGKGHVVVGVTRDDLSDLMDIRLRLEGLAARFAAENMSDTGRARMKELADLQEFYTKKRNLEKLREIDDAFHEAIYGLCGRAALQDVLRPIHRKIQRYRRASLAQRGAKSTTEHKAICEALCAGDADAAERLVVEHIRNARTNMIRRFEQNG